MLLLHCIALHGPIGGQCNRPDWTGAMGWLDGRPWRRKRPRFGSPKRELGRFSGGRIRLCCACLCPPFPSVSLSLNGDRCFAFSLSLFVLCETESIAALSPKQMAVGRSVGHCIARPQQRLTKRVTTLGDVCVVSAALRRTYLFRFRFSPNEPSPSVSL